MSVQIPSLRRLRGAEVTKKIDHRHPDVRKDLLAWGSWVLDVCHGVQLHLYI